MPGFNASLNLGHLDPKQFAALLRAHSINPPPEIPDNLFGAGKGYAMAVYQLMRRDVYAPPLHLPMLFLTGFSVELTLKAALVSVGSTPKQLKALGHNLPDLFAKACELGYKPPTEDIAKLVALMDKGHRELNFRYIPNVNLIEAPSMNLVQSALSQHVDAIEEQFDVWKDSGLPPAER